MTDVGGRRFASASEDGSVRIWSLQAQPCLLTLRHDEPFRAIDSRQADDEQSCLLAAGDATGGVALWKIDRIGATQIAYFKAHHAAIRRARFLRDGSLATCGEDNSLRIWNGTTLKLIHEENHGNFVTDVIELFNGTKVSCGYDGTLRWT